MWRPLADTPHTDAVSSWKPDPCEAQDTSLSGDQRASVSAIQAGMKPAGPISQPRRMPKNAGCGPPSRGQTRPVMAARARVLNARRQRDRRSHLHRRADPSADASMTGPRLALSAGRRSSGWPWRPNAGGQRVHICIATFGFLEVEHRANSRPALVLVGYHSYRVLLRPWVGTSPAPAPTTTPPPHPGRARRPLYLRRRQWEAIAAPSAARLVGLTFDLLCAAGTVRFPGSWPFSSRSLAPRPYLAVGLGP